MKPADRSIRIGGNPSDVKTGNVCPMPARGAMGSAILTIFLWNLNIILAGLGLGGMAFGAWFARYRFFMYLITFTLLGTSFYRIYVKGKGDVGVRTKIVLWCVALVSISLTTASIIKNL